MPYTYRMSIHTAPKGNDATHELRNAVADALSDSIEAGESLTVSVEADGHLSIEIASDRSMGASEMSSYAEAARSTASGWLEAGEDMIVSDFEVVGLPWSRP